MGHDAVEVRIRPSPIPLAVFSGVRELRPSAASAAAGARVRSPSGQAQPCGLTGTQARFILEYEANGRNATRAYMRTHPNCRSAGAAAVEGLRTLRNPKVARVLEQVQKDRARRLTMDADEAAMLTAIRARADLRLAFNHNGELLAPGDWPDELAKAIKSYKPDGTIVLLDQQRATETILQMHGKLKSTVAVNHFDHVAYLAGKQGAKDSADDD